MEFNSTEPEGIAQGRSVYELHIMNWRGVITNVLHGKAIELCAHHNYNMYVQ